MARARGPVYTGRASTGGGGFQVVGSQDFHELATRLKNAEKPVRLAVNKGLRKVAKPLGEEMLRNGAEAMPKGGGLSDRVKKTRVTLGMLRGGTGASARVELRLKSREGYDLPALDKGNLRHPVFNKRNRMTGKKVWVGQSVPAGEFTKPFEEAAPKVRDELALQIQSALEQIAGG